MKLWILKRKGIGFYDLADGFVIRAETAQDARALAANSRSKDEKIDWLDSNVSSCRRLHESGRVGIVLEDIWEG